MDEFQLAEYRKFTGLVFVGIRWISFESLMAQFQERILYTIYRLSLFWRPHVTAH